MNDDRDLIWKLPEGYEPASEYARGGIVIRPIEAEMEVGELVVPLDDRETFERLKKLVEEKERQWEAFQEFAAQMRKVVVLVAESAAAAFGALNEALMQLTACTAESMAAAWEEMMKLAEQDDDLLDQEQEDRHDGATMILTIWLPPVPSLKKLYGQGVDYGGLAHPSGADPPRR